MPQSVDAVPVDATPLAADVVECSLAGAAGLPLAIGRMNASRALMERLAAGEAPIYAVNTGVGLLANVRIPRDDLDQLQRNVIRSHCGRRRRSAAA